jgi:hypothetical protein
MKIQIYSVFLGACNKLGEETISILGEHQVKWPQKDISPTVYKGHYYQTCSWKLISAGLPNRFRECCHVSSSEDKSLWNVNVSLRT